MGKVLIAYFSRAGENYFEGTVKRVDVGNNEKVVSMLLEAIEADTFRIEMEMPYSDDYIKCTEQAKIDLNINARPRLAKYLENLDGYDKVILVYPNYWGSVPMALYSFGEDISWAGVQVYPICTSEGSGFGNSVSAIKKICRGAELQTGLTLVGSHVDEARGKINEWLEDKNFIQ